MSIINEEYLKRAFAAPPLGGGAIIGAAVSKPPRTSTIESVRSALTDATGLCQRIAAIGERLLGTGGELSGGSDQPTVTGGVLPDIHGAASEVSSRVSRAHDILTRIEREMDIDCLPGAQRARA